MAGASESTEKVRPAVAELVFPTESVAVAAIICDPWLNGEVGVQLHAPLPFVVAVQIVVLFSFTLTVLFASAVPLMLGVVEFTSAPAAGPLITGTAGAVVSTVNATAVDAGLEPTKLVAVAVMLCAPLLYAADVQLQAPLAFAAVVHRVVAPSFTVIVALARPVPVMVGIAFVVLPAAGAVMLGAGGID